MTSLADNSHRFADEILKESDSVVQRRKEVGKMVQALMKSEAIVASVV